MADDTRQSPRLRPISVGSITVNPNNPRGHDPADDPSFWYLVESIGELGILVPLLVRQMDENTYQLVDGERRFRAAKELAMKEVPAYVIVEDMNPEAVQKTMFHIHHNRAGWGPLEECRALEPFYEEVLRERGAGNGEFLMTQLVKRTRMNKTTARNRLQFLRWPADVKHDAYEGRAPYWFIVELEDKIVEPALKNYPEYFDRVHVDDVRRFLFRKWQRGVVGAARNVRAGSVITRYKPTPQERPQARQILDQLVMEEDLSFEEAREAFLSEFPDAEEPPRQGPRALYNSVLRLTELLDEYEGEYILEPSGTSKVDPGIFVAALDGLAQAVQGLSARVSQAVE